MASKSLGDLYVSLSARTAGFTDSLLKAGRSMETLADIASNATGQVTQFLSDSVASFLEAEKVSMRLELALRQTHGELIGFASSLSTWADATERATGVDGDFITSIQQLLVQMKIAPNQVNRLTQAALDLAAATGGSARQAANLLARASAENAEELKRWGVKVDEAKVQAEGFTAVLEEVERVYGGTSQQMNEASRAISENRAAWGDLKEAIGSTLVEMVSLQAGGRRTVTILDGLTEFFSSKKAEEVERYRQRVDALSAARDKEARLTEAVRESQAELESLKGSPFYEAQAAALGKLNEELLAAEQRRKALLGFDTGPAPVMSFADEDGLTVETDLWKKREEFAEAATEAYERFARAAQRASDTAAGVDARQSSAGMAAAAAAEAASFKAIEMEAQFASEVEALARAAAEESAEAMARAARAEEQSAAEAFQRMYRESRAFAEAAARASQQAFSEIGDRLLSSLGEGAQIVQRAVQAGMAGGPMAAIASVAVDLLSRSKSFEQLVATLNGLMQKLADSLGPLVEPLIPLVGAVGLLVEPLAQLAGSFGALLVEAVEPLTPMIVLVATVVQGLIPVLSLLMQASLVVQQPLAMLGGPVLRGLFDVLKFVGTMVLEVVTGLGNAWNGIVGAVQTVFRELADISVFGKHPLGFLDDWAAELVGAKVNTHAMAKELAELTGLSYELALAKAKEHAATLANYEAQKKANQELSNVPQRWRRALRAAQAEDRQGPPTSGSPPWAGGSTGGGAPPPPGTHGASPAYPPVTVTVPGGGSFTTYPGAPTPSLPVPGGGGFRFPGGFNMGAQAAPAVASVTFNINGYEIGPALEEAQRRLLDGTARRSYGTSGSVTSTASLLFGGGLAPAVG